LRNARHLLHVGFGATFDEARLIAIPSGAVYVAPAKVPHRERRVP
jgi:hypothetical protein